MAIYRAVGQNTYKFVTETNFTLSQDLTVPNRAYGFPILRLTTDSSRSSYENYIMIPTSTSTSYASFAFKSGISSSSVTINGISGGVCYMKPVVVDGETYYGTQYYQYQYKIGWGASGLNYYFPKTVFKVIMYVASSNTITTQEYTVSKGSFYCGDNNYSYYIYLNFPKAADDIILAIETVFPEE